MEPMHLGSPVSGQTSPGTTSPYLPGFLMGDPTPTVSPGQSVSPTKTPRHVHFAPNLISPIPATPTGPESSERISQILVVNKGEKAGGPPTVSLFDTLQSTAVISPLSVHKGEKTGGPPTRGLFDTLQSTTVASPLSQTCTTTLAHTAALYSHEEDTDLWVTVFGFPVSAAPSVLGHFSQIGSVVEHKYPGQGNWVSIRYHSKIDVKRALSYNGRIFGNNIMIGVISSKDHSVLKDVTNVNSLSSPVTPKSPVIMRSARRLESPMSPYVNSPNRIRPLTGPSHTENEVTGTQNTPTKNTSIVSRTMDYFFGW